MNTKAKWLLLAGMLCFLINIFGVLIFDMNSYVSFMFIVSGFLLYFLSDRVEKKGRK